MPLLQTLKKVFPRTLPVLSGYLFLGIAYGIAMRARGFGPVWPLMMSLFIYGGSMQFALIDQLTRTFAPLTILLLSVLIQARHLFYGLSMLEAYLGTAKWKPYLVFSLTDETYSLVVGMPPRGENAGRWYACVSLLDHVYWCTGTLLGSLLGSLLPTAYLAGIDFSMTALFVVICTEQSMDSFAKWKAGGITAREALFAPLLGGLSTLFSLIALGQSSFLLLAMALILTGFLTRWLTEEKERRT